MDALLDAEARPRCLLVQWVPHAFGRRSLNVAFCAWVRSRGRKGDRIEIMAHEAFHAFGEGSWRQDGAAVIHRVMVTLLLARASRVWVSIPAWANRLRPYAWGRRLPFCWLPVPSNVPFDANPRAVADVRARFPAGVRIVGHFGTFGARARRDLGVLVPGLADADPCVGVLLIGRDSDGFRDALIDGRPALAPRVLATGRLDPPALSHALQACDVLAQPYEDGASTRRGTLMAALSHGVAVVTTTGKLTDPTWHQTDAAVTVAAGDLRAFENAVLQLSADRPRQQRLAVRARALYAERFDVSHTLSALLSDACQPA
jgi:glycosyltransferase involved in cell wall biosynthesis